MTEMKYHAKIGFLGIGKMGLSIARGLLSHNPDQNFKAFDPNASQSSLPANIQLVDSAAHLDKECEIILICVKPQILSEALSNLSGEKKYISIAAGITLDTLKSLLSSTNNVQIARVMPNISAQVQYCVSGIYADSEEMNIIAKDIFSSLGYTLTLDKEEKMHALTGVSGSGPAFVFSFIQALAEGGVMGGLPYDQALELAAHTVLGAAKMLLETGSHPGLLRNQVTSPAGTTIYGLKALEDGGFSGLVMDAVTGAAFRSEELGKK